MPGSAFGIFSQRRSARRAAVLHQLGQRIGQPPGADVVDEQDGVALAELPAAVDHFLAAALDLGVVALHRGEVEVSARSAEAIDEAAPPPRPISIAGPPSTISVRPPGISPFARVPRGYCRDRRRS
jgi:hypothetical protein